MGTSIANTHETNHVLQQTTYQNRMTHSTTPQEHKTVPMMELYQMREPPENLSPEDKNL